MPARLLRIALLIETSREYGRGLLRGVMQFEREHGPWSTHFEPRGLFDPPPAWLSRWKGDGILARIATTEMADAVRATRVPTIDLRLSPFSAPLPGVGIDNSLIVDLAFQHLWGQGFRSLAFFGRPRGADFWSDFRADRLARLARETGAECSVFQPPAPRPAAATWEFNQARVTSWLAALPRPLGVMAYNDEHALQVLDAARHGGLRVPDDVGVVGVDNDELFCNLANPPLSSVHLGIERVGYRAAAELRRRILGKKKAAPKKVLLAPLGVIARQSTNILADCDDELSGLIRALRASACDGVKVQELLRACRHSTSTLQRRFKALLGRSPKEEISRLRLDRARQLLVDTDLPIGEIASRCGFSELKHLSTIFRKSVGVSPIQYRQQNRVGRDAE